MIQSGFKLDSTETTVDSSLSVPSGGSWTAGSSFDLGPDTAIQAVRVTAQFGVTGGATDGYKVEVKVQWSRDGTSWPDLGEGDYLDYFEDTTGGASLTRSRISAVEPHARYGRFIYKNSNSTDAVTVNSTVGYDYVQTAG